LQLLAYLQSWKQTKLFGGTPVPGFLYANKVKDTAVDGTASTGSKTLDGKAIYVANCQACHQPNGEGLKGAFPPLKGSPIVLGENLETYVGIIMNGYDARAEYGVMPPVGTNASFTENDIAALINFERSSWGNAGRSVTPEEVKKMMDLVKLTAAK
jgi:cytochrome c oxidase cbb3-type subunit 2